MTTPAPLPSFSDFIISLIRTVVPAIVGTALAWGASKGLDLTQYGNAVNAWLVPAVIALYYALARLLESKWPVFGLLLGARKQPAYIDQSGANVPAPVLPPRPVDPV